MMRKYGLSTASLQELLHRQAARCAICLKRWQDCTKAKRTHDDAIFLQYLYVDHAHKTGKVRGLLCNACNTAIGLFEEDRARLLSALSYLDARECR
ncbi:MAG: endonuclease VII domain-containing protein [Candidatus Cybelea sp.]